MNSPTNDGSTENKVSLKVGSLSVIALELVSSEPSEIEKILEEKRAKGASFFLDTPLLLDLNKIEDKVDVSWLKQVDEIVKSKGFIPAGVVGVSKEITKEAGREGIVCWPTHNSSLTEPTPKPQPKPSVKVVEAEPKEDVLPEPEAIPTKVVQQPVRSGQRIYAKDSDLIITSAVNPGGEVMADGNIHIYGSLKGRALAGVAGREDARIYCHDLQAELVAIAGYYTINEDLPANRRKTAVKIRLDAEKLEIEPLHP